MDASGIERARSLVGTGSNPDGRPNTDFYATPEYATKALLDREPFGHTILEPACGTGSMSEVLMDYGYDVYSSDLYHHGYGLTGINFLEAYEYYDQWLEKFDAIITNPPYREAEAFLKQALRMTEPTQGKVALLLKLQFLEGQKRKLLLQRSPLSRVYVFSKRLTFTRNNEPVGNSGMMAFAWYVWDWSILYTHGCKHTHLEWI